MSNILEKIEATKFQEVERLKVHVSLNEIKEHKNLKDPCRDFAISTGLNFSLIIPFEGLAFFISAITDDLPDK